VSIADPELAALLDHLRRHWSFAYDVAFDRFGQWHARHVTSGVIMDAETGYELDDMIDADYRARREHDAQA
jgi:hypothetical protein